MREDELEAMEERIYSAMKEICLIVDYKYKFDPIEIATILGGFMGSICCESEDYMNLLSIQVSFCGSMIETIKKRASGTTLDLKNPDDFK